MRVSAIPRLLVELSATETAEELHRMINAAVIHHNLNHDRVRQALALHAHRPGIAVLHTAEKLDRDRLRGARLLASGIRTIRITDSRFAYDEDGVRPAI